MERDIIERLMDFERCGLTPGTRVNLRECAAIEIHNLRERLKATESERDTAITDSQDRIADLNKEVDRLREKLQPFIEADWYAAGHGKFEARLSKEVLDAAKGLQHS